MTTITEHDVAIDLVVAYGGTRYRDSVGVGDYRIDLHTGTPRVVTEDITPEGETISAGGMVVVSLPSATASTSASGSNWHVWNCRWLSPPYSGSCRTRG